MSTVSVCQQRPPSALPAAPRFENRRCDPAKTEGEKKTDSPTHLKVANRSGLVAEGSPARCVSEREKGGGFAARESRTVGSGAPLVTFPATGKSPGCRAWLCHALAERLHQGWSAEGALPPRISWAAGAPAPAPALPGERSTPLHLYPKTSKKLHPNMQLRATKKRGFSPRFFAAKLQHAD